MITEPKSNENTIAAAAADPVIRLQRAAGTAIAAGAVKAKFLAKQEEYHIWQLAALVIEKQVTHGGNDYVPFAFPTEFQIPTPPFFRSGDCPENFRKYLYLITCCLFS